MAGYAELFLQGCKPVEEIEPGDVTDGVVGRVKVSSKTLRPRPDMAPLVMLNTVEGEWLRYEPGFPVAFYGPDRKLDAWPGRLEGKAPPTP